MKNPMPFPQFTKKKFAADFWYFFTKSSKISIADSHKECMAPELEAARQLAVEKLPLIITENGIGASGDGRFRDAIFIRDAAYFGLLTLSKKQNGELKIITEGVKRTLEVTAAHQGQKTTLENISLEAKNRLPHEIQGKTCDQRRLKLMKEAGAPVVEVEGHLEMVNYWALDANALWNCLFAKYLEVTGDKELRDKLWPNFVRSNKWIGEQGLLLRGGREFSNSPSNLWWKDSENSLINEDGSLPEYPIAPLDVNSFAYLSDVLSAGLFETNGNEKMARTLRFRAQRRKELINKMFWVENLGIFAPALDKYNRPVEIVTSDSLIALWTGVVDEDKKKRVAQRLMQPDLLAPTGLRTRSSKSRQYNPNDYQNGNVWNELAGIMADACEKSGMEKEAAVFDSKVHIAANLNFRELHRDLEGQVEDYTEIDPETGIPVPVACALQTWVVGSVLSRSAV